MNRTEKTPSAATLRAAMAETGNEIVSNFHCTSSGAGRQGKIAALLLRGEENAIPGPELARMLNVNPRTLRLLVDQERLECPICASDFGYFLPDSGNKGALELQKFLRRMDSRCAANRKVTKSARMALKEYQRKPLDGQQTFFDGGGGNG